MIGGGVVAVGDYYGEVAYEAHREIRVFGNAELFKEIGFFEAGLVFIRSKQAVEAKHTSAQSLIIDYNVLLLHILKEDINLNLRVIEGAVEYRENKILFSARVKICENPGARTSIVASLAITLAVCEPFGGIGIIRKLKNVVLFAREKRQYQASS